MQTREIVIQPNGDMLAIYNDDVGFQQLGPELGEMTIKRASHVEPTADGRWTADMSPVDGPLLGPFDARADALKAETDWLRENHLGIR